MMEKNLYEIILDKLGVEEGERFTVSTDQLGLALFNPYHFKDGFLVDRTDEINDALFVELLKGKATIEKLPWIPKVNEIVYFIVNSGEKIGRMSFDGTAVDLAMLKCEWYFRTEEEAEANRERVLKQMKEVMGDGTYQKENCSSR